MSRLSPSFVLGYHGCDAATAERIFSGKDGVRQSKNDYDWLGTGSYFWEGDPARAMAWAREQLRQGKLKEPAVVGAVIDLGNCLNLSTQEGVGLLQDAYNSYRDLRMEKGEPLAVNKDPVSGTTEDRIIRRLDNAVIQQLHSIIDQAEIEPFDTVWCIFLEGQPAFPGAGFKDQTHIQIAVRNSDSIIGYFRPRRRR